MNKYALRLFGLPDQRSFLETGRVHFGVLRGKRERYVRNRIKLFGESAA
jgi:hypothetical protein